MKEAHRRVAAAIAVLLLSSCTTATPQPVGTPTPSRGTQTSSSAASGGSTAEPSSTTPTASTMSSPSPSTVESGTSTPLTTEPTVTTQPTAKASDPTPVPKVQRAGDKSQPTASASPAEIKDKVAYDDGVILHIEGIKFGEETKEGPGRFPGRAYAIISLEMSNGSKRAINLDATVVTVLDAADTPVAPVYVEEAKVADFSGKLEPGKSTKARYAFAVAKDLRSQVTVVVDFDGVHTSAVFRGELK